MPVYVDEIRVLRATIVDGSGDLVDPDTIVYDIISPTQDVTTATYADADITRDSIGVYSYEWTVGQAGVWVWRVETTGVPARVVEEIIYVSPSLEESIP